jgi:ferredoxin--NADP+ reductase/benzoate/toluate 1,2-dioxygenase reductase subunit
MENSVLNLESLINIYQKKIQRIRFLTNSTFVLTFDRGDIQFIAGQHITIGTHGSLNQREYSIYSGENQNYFEILVKEVLDGNVSMQLRNSKPGEILETNGPFGSFRIEKRDMYSRKHLFIATGTGISPFHSMVLSYPGLDYKILHGISYLNEAYERSEYLPKRYITCTSKEKGGDFNGRVTGFLPDYKLEPDTVYYLCGNSSMIYEVNDMLLSKGVSGERILKEVYF